MTAIIGVTLPFITYVIIGFVGYIQYHGVDIKADFLLTISIEDTGKWLFVYLYCAYTA